LANGYHVVGNGNEERRVVGAVVEDSDGYEGVLGKLLFAVGEKHEHG